jgi:hypothetical protein
MAKLDARQVVNQIEPTTKAARLRTVMPDIERKLAAGVRLAQIHQGLVDAGFELTLATLKTYLHRYRKKHAAAGTEPMPMATARLDQRPAGDEPHTAGNTAVSIQELDRLMHPDPAEQATELARYERVARQRRRSRTHESSDH